MSDQQPQPQPQVNAQGVIITFDAIYQQLLGIRTDVTEMRADMSRVLANDDDHEQRLRKVESDYVSKRGVIALITVLIGLATVVEPVAFILLQHH